MKTIKLMQGNEACFWGAIAAGMRFFGGYPITPSTEIAELASLHLPKYGGKFIQMEDEIASIASIIGASLTGVKSMTATSGPGFSLMQENLGYACFTEIPCVVVNVQRGGPSTGLPTSPSQGDIMQARWGTHGDHSIIVISPSTIPEIYKETIRAFNLSEIYRTPVILLLDEVIAHLREKIDLSKYINLEVIERKKPTCSPKDYLPYKFGDLQLSPLASFGSGYRYHVTGLFHDETGFPSGDSSNAKRLMDRLQNKISYNKENIISYETYKINDADSIIISYGSISRGSKDAIDSLRKKGYKVGLFRPITIWPFPEKKLIEIINNNIKNIFIIEMNMGQLYMEIDRIIKKSIKKNFYGKYNGKIITPMEITEFVEGVLSYE